ELDGAARRLHQPQHAARHRRFATAGFADQPERLALAHGKADAVHRMHGADAPTQHAAAHGIMFDEVGDFKQGTLIGHGAPTSSAARQHAAKSSPSTSCSGGYSARQRSMARLHRGAKAQPGGRLVSEGTMPGISFSRASVLAPNEITAGIEAISPRV